MKTVRKILWYLVPLLVGVALVSSIAACVDTYRRLCNARATAERMGDDLLKTQELLQELDAKLFKTEAELEHLGEFTRHVQSGAVELEHEVERLNDDGAALIIKLEKIVEEAKACGRQTKNPRVNSSGGRIVSGLPAAQSR